MRLRLHGGITVAVLALSISVEPSFGQGRGVARPGVTPVGQARPVSRGAPVGGPARRVATPPFISTLRFVPGRFAGQRVFCPIRSTIFGLVAFDPSWLWAPIDTQEPLVAPGEPLPPPGPRPTGGLQLDVEPRRALVYVDGWFTGLVDNFSGYYRHLEAPAGWHTIEIIAPDFQPLMFNIAVTAGRTTIYRNSLVSDR